MVLDTPRVRRAHRLIHTGPVQPETKYVDVGGSQVAYQTVGSGPIDVLQVTTWFSHIDGRWQEPNMARFQNRLASFSRLIVFDKRGSGASDPFPPGRQPTWEDWLDDVTAVLDAVGSERAALMAYGDSGPQAILFAATFPERTSALILGNTTARAVRAPGYPFGATPEEREAIVQAAIVSWGKDAYMQIIVPSKADDPEFLEFLARYERMIASPRRAEEQMRLSMQMDVRDVLSSIRVPTLVVHRRDIATPMFSVEHGRYLAANIAGARLVEIEGSDLMPQFENPDATLDEIQEFLTGVRPQPTPDRVLATVMFTDIVGSTERAVKMGDRSWTALLDEHDATVRRVVETFQGRVVKQTGDGFMATFDGPNRAIRCADSLQRVLAGKGIAIRSGIHTGEAELRTNDLGGIAVHMAARVMAQADAAEVMVTSTVRDLVAGSDIKFEDRGRHNLKGIPGKWQLLAVSNAPD